MKHKLRFGRWSRLLLRTLAAPWRLRGTPLYPYGVPLPGQETASELVI